MNSTDNRPLAFYEALMVETKRSPNKAIYEMWKKRYARQEKENGVKISVNGRLYKMPEFCFGTNIIELAGINDANGISFDFMIGIVRNSNGDDVRHYQLLRLVEGDTFMTVWVPMPGG